MKFVNRLSTLAILLAAFGISNIADAQNMGGGGGTGGGGATGGGGTMGGGGTTGGFGGTGTTSGTNTGTSGTGTTSGTSTGTGVSAVMKAFANAKPKFIEPGAAAKTTTTGRATTGGGGGGAVGGLSGGAGGASAFGQNPFGTGAGSTTTSPAIRTRMQSGVVVPLRTQITTQRDIQQNVTTNISQPRFRGVGATTSGSSTVIRGTVTNESDRRMAELMMRLQPGVSRVENRITVSQ